ncbi:hypothetical protein K437DRAFT_45107 [Tilletiaria anomala UBC 951]|uniref:Uncharacterized protein n=1 Tax=Tilletiaria anomala (strain ATCC 24038 / CBS 436.72 / UBC 951) TaxID=1037660 RepID=A0A066WHK0_TILAU|nr:uncharacterized protein K437DRAFT_45107 [Tilletiaria anomala UBC 951]KDN51993.1 hypothetical protein K437DRAFT_45107 [Tilletiaria anomala UBC 951]
MVQASIVIRILISEQKKAQRPHDTSFLEDGYASGYGADTRTCPGLGAETYDEGYASDSRFGPHQGRSAISRRPVLSGRSSGRDEEEGYEMKESVKDENLPSVQHHDLPPTRPKEVDLAPHRQHSETEEQQDPAHVEGRSGSERGGGGGDSGMHVRAPLRQQDSDYGGSTAISSDDGVAAGARGFAASADNRGHRADHPRTAPSKVNTTTSNDGDGNKHGTQFIAVEVLQR